MFRHFGHIQYKIEKCVKNNFGHVFFLEIFVPIDYLFVTLQPRTGLPLRDAGHSIVLSLTQRAQDRDMCLSEDGLRDQSRLRKDDAAHRQQSWHRPHLIQKTTRTAPLYRIGRDMQ